MKCRSCWVLLVTIFFFLMKATFSFCHFRLNKNAIQLLTSLFCFVLSYHTVLVSLTLFIALCMRMMAMFVCYLILITYSSLWCVLIGMIFIYSLLKWPAISNVSSFIQRIQRKIVQNVIFVASYCLLYALYINHSSQF